MVALGVTLGAGGIALNAGVLFLLGVLFVVCGLVLRLLAAGPGAA
ncbi:hypothetical protein [Amycolatopsis sp. Hca4]|nr:hypothetical protein [Amycolatopsis sp. Hca4]